MQSLRSHCDWDLANTGPYCCQSKPARMCRSWKDFGSMHIQPWFQRLNRLSSLSSAVSQTHETVSPLWWIVRRSNLSPISWFSECSGSYFRSFVNIFQTQLPPIPIPISLQLKSEFTWNYLACLSLFILILLVSTPHLSCFFFYIKKSQWPRAGLPLNSVVRILKLQKRPELNGQLGTVVGWDTVEDRCQARLCCSGDGGLSPNEKACFLEE